jgi:hypothetical protein
MNTALFFASFLFSFALAKIPNSIDAYDESMEDPVLIMSFMDKVPLKSVEQFLDIHLNRNISKKTREDEMYAWAKRQGKGIAVSLLSSFYSYGCRRSSQIS